MNKESGIMESMEERYRKMLHELSGHIDPEVRIVWDRFINMVKELLTPAEVSHARNLSDVCDKLLEKGMILFGEYAKLLAIFEIISHKQCQDIVKKYSSLNTNATKNDHMRKYPEPKIGADHVALHCQCDRERGYQSGLIKIVTSIPEEEIQDEKQIRNHKTWTKCLIKDKRIMKEKDFRVPIVEAERGKVCIFIKITAPDNEETIVKRMTKRLIPDIFVYDRNTILHKNQGNSFYLEIETKVPYTKNNKICPDHLFYKKSMKKLLRGYRNKRVKVDNAMIMKKSGKYYVPFQIKSKHFSLKGLTKYLSKRCPSYGFEEISLCEREHLHTTWLKMNDKYNIKKEVEEHLSKKEDTVYNLTTCCPKCE